MFICSAPFHFAIRDERYRIFYPSRELAGYIPAHLGLLFIGIPLVYMGLNIVYHDLDDYEIWNTRYNNKFDNYVPLGSIPDIDEYYISHQKFEESAKDK